jgi:hypothetical protein
MTAFKEPVHRSRKFAKILCHIIPTLVNSGN